MKKWKAALWAIAFGVVICAACSSRHQTMGATKDVLYSADYLMQDEKGDAVVEKQSMTVYYSNETFDGLKKETVEVDEIFPEEILAQLGKHHIVPFDTKLESFEETINDAGEACLYISVTKNFGSYLSTMTKESKQVILASLTNTFIANYHADKVVLSIEKKELSEIDNDYTKELEWFIFPVENVNQ